ncbi:MAG TPA: TetR/AcrR family transcriptional regulator [Acidocella sp.]|jgi:AcrR family transcriptional regulator|nr:TetR/AcrR family transcriptional regulator [Acidocella sp.]
MAEQHDVPGGGQARERAAEREARIVAQAVRLFAEKGFQSSTRDLARRAGIAQSVIFRHFASKEALRERVYQEIYLSKWDPRWQALLTDRTRPLPERLLMFYREYITVIFHPEWIRIFMFAGLKGGAINARYFALLREHIVAPIARELRHRQGTALEPDNHVPAEDMERAWGLHGRIFYLALRELIYGIPVPVSLDTVIKDAIDIFVASPPLAAGSASAFRTTAMAAPEEPPFMPEKPAARMPPAARERSIVTGAVSFFAEHGTDGELRKLASHLGITHPLLYRYFPTKEALLERVYEEVYAHRWNADWRLLLCDRSQPLADRLIRFYRAYLSVIDDRNWMRIFIFSGLSGAAIHRRYLEVIRDQFVEPVAAELLVALQGPGRREISVTDREREIVWGLHGEIFYLAMRKWIYGIAPEADPERLITSMVTDFVMGATTTLNGERKAAAF